MSVTVKLRYIRHSAKKMHPYTRLFAGRNLDNSIDKSRIMPQDSAQFIYKALLMAKAAASQKEYEPSSLQVVAIHATEGPHIKRIRANAKGRANKYLKHLAHLTVTVAPTKPVEKKAKAHKKETK